MKKILLTLFYSLFATALVVGHSIDSSILEDTQLVYAIGFDYVDEETMKGTAAAPLFPPGENPKPIDIQFTVTAHTAQNAVQELQRESERPLRMGRLQVFLISKELAEHGVRSVIDAPERSPNIRRDLNIAIVDGSAETLLTASHPNTEVSAFYISNLLDKNIKSITPPTTLNHLLNRLDGFGQDAFLPVLKQHDKHIRYQGLAIFREDRYIDQLSFRDSYLFTTLFNPTNKGYYEVKYHDKYVAVLNIRSKPKYTFNGPQERPHLTVRLSVEGRLTDASGLGFKEEKIHEFEKVWAKELEERSEKLIKKLQELNTDPLGIGAKAKNKYRNFNKGDWESLYPTIPVTVKVEARIRGTGLTE